MNRTPPSGALATRERFATRFAENPPRAERMLAAVSAILLSMAVQPPRAEAADPVKLRYHLKPGAVYEGSASTSMTTQMTMEGLPPEAAAMAQTIGRDLHQELTVKTSMTVSPALPDGALPVELRIVDGRISMTMAGQPMEIPGMKNAFTDAPPMHGRISPDGRVLEIAPHPERDLPAAPGDTSERIAQSMPELPDRELKVGDSFEVPIKIAIPGLPMAGRMETESKCVYLLKSVSNGEAVFDLSTTVTAGADGEGGERMKMKITGGGPGRAVFDLEEGIFTEAKTDMKVEMEVEMPLPSGPDPPSANEAPSDPKVVRIRATMQGPATYTMARSTRAR